MYKAITEKQKKLITQLLIKCKRKEEIKRLNVLSKSDADLYIQDLIKGVK